MRHPGCDEPEPCFLRQPAQQGVSTYLISQGAIQASKVTVEGRGGQEPIAGNDTDEGRAQNRRVEIILLD
jgi:OOP family OmpA-OmpF porin